MIRLRPYQEEAAHFLSTHPRAILADMVGLGKTYPTISAAYYGGSERSRLIVCPPYLMLQWREAIRAYVGSQEPVLLLNRSDPPIEPWTWVKWVIVGYHTLMNAGIAKHPELLQKQWNVVIFDEAHRLRGRNNQWTKTAFKLKAENLWMLTGTPVVHDPGDLWPLLKLCDPKEFRSYWKFVQQWCMLNQTPWTTEIGPVKSSLERDFHAMLDQYMLRRRIEDHLPELPPQIDHEVIVKLPPAIQAAHDKAKKEWRIEHPDLDDPVIATNGAALLTKLRQLTSGALPLREGGKAPKENPKRDAVLGILEDHPNEPAIVFTWYVDTAKLLWEAITNAGRHAYLITGSASPVARAQVIEHWKALETGVIVATISALQEGANLQNAHSVIFAEHDYLPASIEQATARVRRFGQQYPVNVYHITADKTVDRAVWKTFHRRDASLKRALADLYDEDLVTEDVAA